MRCPVCNTRIRDSRKGYCTKCGMALGCHKDEMSSTITSVTQPQEFTPSPTTTAQQPAPQPTPTPTTTAPQPTPAPTINTTQAMQTQDIPVQTSPPASHTTATPNATRGMLIPIVIFFVIWCGGTLFGAISIIASGGGAAAIVPLMMFCVGLSMAIFVIRSMRKVRAAGGVSNWMQQVRDMLDERAGENDE